MKKSDINRYIDALQKEALDNLNKDYTQKVKEAGRAYADSLGIDKEVKQAQSLARLLKAELLKVESKIYAEQKGYMKNPVDRLDEYIPSLNSVHDYISRNKYLERLPEIVAIETLAKSTKAKILKAYETLKQNVSTYKTADEAIPYLESMGITIPQEEKIQVMLIKPVDPTLLRYNG